MPACRIAELMVLSILNYASIIARAKFFNRGVYPLLNPAYWDGHMFGDGHGLEVDPELWTAPPFGSAARFARHALREYLESMHTYFPLETYGKDTVFDPEEWAPGTVTLFDREILRHPQPNLLFEPDAYAKLAVPLQPTDLRANLDPRASGLTIHKDDELGIVYLRSINWGIVAPTKSGRNTLERVSTSMVWKSCASDKVSMGPLLPPQSVPVKVGSTSHDMRAEERIERTNVLQVCAIGSSKRQKRRGWAGGWLGRFATGGA